MTFTLRDATFCYVMLRFVAVPHSPLGSAAAVLCVSTYGPGSMKVKILLFTYCRVAPDSALYIMCSMKYVLINCELFFVLLRNHSIEYEYHLEHNPKIHVS